MPDINYLWDPIEDNVIGEFDDDGNLVAEYTTEPEPLGNIISQRRDGETNCFYSDGLGSTTEVTNSVGDTIAIRAFNAYGETTESTGTVVFPFQFRGEKGYYFDAEVVCYYVRQREYQPIIARWLVPDPVGYADGPNRYTYCVNSPIMFTDASGLTVLVYGWEGAGAALGLSYTPLADVYKVIAEEELAGDVSVHVDFQQKLLGPIAFNATAKTIIARGKMKELEKCGVVCYPRIVLIGYSWGGNTAANVAALMQHQDPKFKIDAVFTIDPVFSEGKGKLATSETLAEFKYVGLSVLPFTIKPSNFCGWKNYFETSSVAPPFVGDKFSFSANTPISAAELQAGPYSNLPKGAAKPGPGTEKMGHIYIPYLTKIQDDWRLLMRSYQGNTLREDYGSCESACSVEGTPTEAE